jgi:hypothetical protein
LVLGALGGARRGDAINLIEQDDGGSELLCALEDLSDGGFGSFGAFRGSRHQDSALATHD